MRRHTMKTLAITQYASSGVDLTFVATSSAESVRSVVTGRFAAGGALGRHQAASWQVFAVLDGQIKVVGAGDEQIVLGSGDAVQFEPGEFHESTALVASTVMIVEASTEIVPT